jgi:hypothetical protein
MRDGNAQSQGLRAQPVGELSELTGDIGARSVIDSQ